MVNQTDQVQLVGHGGELPANGLQSEKETAVVHDRNVVVETNRRTMNFQRAAECVLTSCLSPGGRFTQWLISSWTRVSSSTGTSSTHYGALTETRSTG